MEMPDVKSQRMHGYKRTIPDIRILSHLRLCPASSSNPVSYPITSHGSSQSSSATWSKHPSISTFLDILSGECAASKPSLSSPLLPSPTTPPNRSAPSLDIAYMI